MTTTLVLAFSVFVVSPFLSAEQPRPRVAEALEKGAAYLTAHQRRDGSFGGSSGASGDVGTTGLAVQALSRVKAGDERSRVSALGRGLRFLESRVQKDGLVYDPGEGLRIFKTAMAAQAFRLSGQPRYAARAASLEAAIHGAKRFESESDPAAPPQPGPVTALEQSERLRELAARADADDDTRKAAAFLLQCETARLEGERSPLPKQPLDGAPAVVDGYISYDSFPSLIYRDLPRDAPEVEAVLRALRQRFTLGVNPDLTRRLSRGEKNPGTEGLYFNYLVMAKVLSRLPGAEFVTDSGERHDWPQEVAERLLALQRPDGSWRNDNPRWWEGDACLATSYAILALAICEERAAASRLAVPAGEK